MIRLTAYIGLLIGLILLVSSLFTGEYNFTEEGISRALTNEQKEVLLDPLLELEGRSFESNHGAVSYINYLIERKTNVLKERQEWNKITWSNPHEITLKIIHENFDNKNKNSILWIFYSSLGLILISIVVIAISRPDPQYKPLGEKLYKLNRSFTQRGVLGYALALVLIAFYIVIYWFPAYLSNWICAINPFSMVLSGKEASQWFLYGVLYTFAVLLMGLRMLVKHRKSKYQLVRTGSVMFFQFSFAFIIPQVLMAFNKPYFDFKHIWPLDYYFLFDWRLNELMASGNLGWFMIFWGVLLFLVAVPVFTYFYGKRWYCSWVCGCGALAETAGDPFRKLSSKTLKSWKFERYAIVSVTLFLVFMTILTLYTRITSTHELLGFNTYKVQQSYGFLVGSIFAGVIGTGFYPVFGSRVWCRFGCPLAAYLGFIQRFNSKFRITTNEGQCISCGHCSSSCEMGIDVRWYAQRGQDIVRSSCVGCGICADVCPRGVLRLENGPVSTRKTSMPFEITDEVNLKL